MTRPTHREPEPQDRCTVIYLGERCNAEPVGVDGFTDDRTGICGERITCARGHEWERRRVSLSWRTM